MNSEKPNYFDLVYQVVKEIPKGRVTSYGTIAHYLGLKSGARMVGYAMNASHSLPDVPAQRVVNRQGLLTGKHHFSTPTRMQELLEADGVKVENDRVVDFEKNLLGSRKRTWPLGPLSEKVQAQKHQQPI